MLVSAKEMVQAAYAGHYAIGAFNLNNLEWTKAVLQAAQESQAEWAGQAVRVRAPQNRPGTGR